MEMPVAVVGWSNQAETFLSLVEHYRRMDMFCDCTIACERQFFRAHKVILSMSSEFFESIFSTTPDKNPVIIMNDIDAWQMECLMDYMYKGETSVPDAYFDSLCRVAKCLQIKGFDKVEIYRKAVKLSKQKDSRLLEKQIKEFNNYSNLNFTLEKVVNQLSNTNISRSNSTSSNSGNNSGSNNNNSSNSEKKLTESVSGVKSRSRLKSAHNVPPMVSFLRHFKNCEEFEKSKLLKVQNEDDNKVFVCQKEKSSLILPLQCLYDSQTRHERSSSPPERASPSYDSRESHQQHIKSECTSPSSSSCKRSISTDLRSPKKRASYTPSPAPSPASKKEEIIYPCSDDNNSVSSDEMNIVQKSSPKLLSPASLSRNEFIAKLFLNDDSSPTETVQPPHAAPKPITPVHKRKPPPPLLKLGQSTSSFNFLRKESDFLFSHIKRKGIKSPSPQNPEKTTHYNRPSQPPAIFTPPFTIPSEPDYRLGIKPEHTFLNFDTSKYSSSGRDSPLNLSGKTTKPTNYDDTPERKFLTTDLSESLKREAPSNDPLLKKIQTNKRKRVRGPKSWEYLLRLLQDPVSNPSLIKWEDENSAVFRLICPEIIAQRWGKRTGKHTTEILSYESFARGLRYHYATGALNAVSEKSFVYQFGPKAQKTLHEYKEEMNDPSQQTTGNFLESFNINQE